MQPTKEVGCYGSRVAHSVVVTLLEIHVGHSVIDTLEGCDITVTQLTSQAKGHAQRLYCHCKFILVPSQYALFSSCLSSSDDWICSFDSSICLRVHNQTK